MVALFAISQAAACGYDPHPMNAGLSPDGGNNLDGGGTGGIDVPAADGGGVEAGADMFRPYDGASDRPSDIPVVAIDGAGGVGSGGNTGAGGTGVVVSTGGVAATGGTLSSSGGAGGTGGSGGIDGASDRPSDIPVVAIDGGGGVGSGGNTGAGGTGVVVSTGGVAATGGTLSSSGGTGGTGGSGGIGGTIGDVGISTYLVSGAVQGGPANASITASSSDPNAICSGNACQVQSGGSVVLTAPIIAQYYFVSWTGPAGCASTSQVLTLSNISADTTCVANYQATYLVTVAVAGGPAGTTITPTSSTPGATCVAGSCRIPSGGSVSASAPTLTDWFFEGWSGSSSETTSTVTLTSISSDATLSAHYINQRTVSCTDQPPTNSTTSSTPNVISTYTTAGGWSSPALCPWTCDTDYCNTGPACAPKYLDQIAFTRNTASMWFGGDDRSGIGPRSLGAGQGVTPSTTITMDRFGFNFQSAFSYASTGSLSSQPNVLELDRRDGNGVIQATYTTTLAATFSGGWVYWDTASTKLGAGSLYIFTSFLTTAFTQPVNSGIFGDSSAPYAGGSGYSGQVTSGDLTSWTSWGTHAWDFDFRVQMRNPACTN